jgi:hypothetical protein
VLFSVGAFRKTLDSQKWHLMVSAPRGGEAVSRVSAFLREARHLSRSQRDQFLHAGFTTIDHSPWDPEAPSEDETLNHRLVHIDDVLERDEAGEWTAKKLEIAGSKRFRSKTRLAFNRFANFLNRTGLRFVLRPYRASDAEVAERLVRSHFEEIVNPVGSTPEDYLNLVRLDPDTAGPGYFGRMGFLESWDGRSTPLMLFIGERTGPATVALYATFTRRTPDPLDATIDPTGYSAAPQYCYVRIFQELREMGIEHADLGGSETERLDRFKQQLGARNLPTYWVVQSVK